MTNSNFPTNQHHTAIASLTSLESGLNVKFSGIDKPVFFSWVWLRDHGNDEASMDPNTLQRRVDTFGIPANLMPAKVASDNAQGTVNIDWIDGTVTTVSAQLLVGISGYGALDHQLLGTDQKVLWDQTAPLDELPRVNHDEVMSSDGHLRTWLEHIARYGFSIVDGVPTTDEATEALAERIGPVQETLFGRMWHLSAELAEHGDTAYTTQFLEPHTDAVYYHDAPGLQMFNCQVFDGKGGESILVDAFAIAKQIQAEDPVAFETLCKIIVPGQYLEPGVHVRAERPAFRLNASGELAQVSFNNYDRAPMHLSAVDEKRFYRAYGLFHTLAMEQRNWLKVPLRPGMTLIFDNWRTMHGRMNYVGQRMFYGCYHNMAVFESKLRVLQAAK